MDLVVINSTGHHLSLYISLSGILAAVSDLSCEQDRLCIECSWLPPFSLTPVLQYIVNITNNEDTSPLTISNTNITYCPIQYGQYNIIVAANNTAGLGNVTYRTVKLLPKGNINFLLNIHNEN